MHHKWMFERLKELQDYAQDHDLPALKDLLDQAVDLAMLEVSNQPSSGPCRDPAHSH